MTGTTTFRGRADAVRRRLMAQLRGAPPAAPEPSPARDDLLVGEAAADERAIVERCTAYSMTGPARILALIDAVRYCTERDIPGSFVECGVWRGGSVLAMILTLQHAGRLDRDIYLYDTFEGMTEPSSHDVSALEPEAVETWREARREGRRPWEGMFADEVFNEQSVRSLLEATGYPSERLHFVRGPVEETVPDAAPPEIALLRLDTDWYESTRHEMIHLYPRLAAGGVLIVDDYGHWQGARKAVDEYFADHGDRPLLHRVDYTARMAVKP